MNEDGCMIRKSWELPFLAEPKEVAVLRRILRLHLKAWGLPRQTEVAQLCVSEIVANVIRHVGAGTPTALRLSMSGTYLRVEVRDPDSRALPTLVAVGPDSESGRGMALVDAMADRWGVLLGSDHKVTWCEIATDLSTPNGHAGGVRVTRAEAMISIYGAVASPRAVNASRLSVAVAKDTAIDVIVDLLHWMVVHGFDADDVLDMAQARFESGL
ncbi:ATP-binding protein [Streptomyces sp. ISL-10]|uniref:ATP-binding protein n=1 Tax=Streptomyces sp. ISL-10 TaxID=2819172 RepID=UPI001BECA175|nr:ATP-binding protein [Streptomyces sp. ISL-10]MBT2367017.1 ATP-binding protein [Streptomyces sp. ISL-10]